MTGDNRRDNALIEVEIARDALRAADGLVALGLRRDAMSRAYYSVFHAARALLLLEGLEAKTHAGVLRLVAERLVRTGKLELSVNVLLAKLQGIRHQSDYGYAFELDDASARSVVEEARRFVEQSIETVSASSAPDP